MTVNKPSLIIALGAVLTLSGCSVLDSDKVDYRSTQKAPPLVIPPDLTQLSKETRYTIVDGGVSASSSQPTLSRPGQVAVAALAVGDVRIERSGNQRWLVINRPPEQLWDTVKDFWQENGFLLAMDQSNLGIMETDWAENRAKIPQDMLRAALGKLLDSLYSTPERDKFRTRLERNSQGNTEIFISHRGMMEIYTREAKDQTVWQPRPADPELEAEFLRRLMLKLGASAEQTQTLVATATITPASKVQELNGFPALTVQDGFDRAWRRVGLALDRTGFTVEDRDRNKGIYFVRYVATSGTEEPGFFGKLFSSSKAQPANKLQILVRSQANNSTVTVQDDNGKPDNSEAARRIVKVLSDEIK
jgi:outer membrane protein assembly factor BamC